MDAPSDDLDVVVKNLFSDLEFKKKNNLCSINSINWARIMLQTVTIFHSIIANILKIHYFFSYFRVCDSLGVDVESPEVIFSIPTGAFGNGTAGLLAKLMGLPIYRYVIYKLHLHSRLLVATNENDILYQFFHKGTFERTEVVQTVSPSIDIQVPYNFERFLYYLSDGRVFK